MPAGSTRRMDDSKDTAEPRTRDADRSRDAILTAARDEFASHGLGGARVDASPSAPASTSGCCTTTSSTRTRCSARCSKKPTATSARPSSSCIWPTCRRPTQSAGLTEFTWNYYLAHPEFLTLLNSENLHHARHLSDSPRARALNSPLIETLAEVLERGRATVSFAAASPAAALHLDRRAGLLLPVEQAHAVGHFQPQPDDGQGAQRTAVAHLRCDPRLRADRLTPRHGGS